VDEDTAEEVAEPRQRDWFWLEVLALLAVLVSGAGLRYALSTALPYDAWELSALADARVADHSLRVPFIMINGASLMAFYLIVRRSAGVPAAFAALLLVQTSLSFQNQALRIRWAASGILPLMVGFAIWRFTRPHRRLPAGVSRALMVVIALLALRGAHLGFTLPTRVTTIKAETTADPAPLYASLIACGGGVATSVDRLRVCALEWPEQRGLAQQEALFEHASRLGGAVFSAANAESLAEGPGERIAVFDAAGVGFLVASAGSEAETAERIARAAAADFYRER
jgi:hypothetical protein